MIRKRVSRLALLGGLATLGTVGIVGLTQAHAASVKQGVPSVAPTRVAIQPIVATKPTGAISTAAPAVASTAAGPEPIGTARPTPVAGADQDSKGVWHVPGGKTTDEASAPDTRTH
jgi:hypothetical protein